MAALAVVLILATATYLELLQRPAAAFVTGDSMWAASVAHLSLFETVIFVLRFDIHPPVYYMLINLWSVLGSGDHVLLASSVVTQVGLAALTFFLGRRLSSDGIALCAACVIAFMPILLEYVVQLRMYLLLAVLGLTTAYQSERLTSGASAGKRRILLYAVTCELAAYSNAAGFLVALSSYSCGALILHARLEHRAQLRWLLVHVAIGAAALPAIAMSIGRKAGQATVPGARQLLETFTALVIGTYNVQTGELVAVVAFAILALAAFASAKSRRWIIAYLCVPMILCFVLSYVGRPMWIARMFIYAIPLLVLAACCGTAAVIDRHARTPRLIAAGATGMAIAVFAAAAFAASSGRPAPDYPMFNRVLAREAKPGDCIFISHFDAHLWGMARYMVGPDWGDPLSVQVPATGRWKNIMAKMSPRTRAILHLEPKTDEIDVHGIRLIGGYPSKHAQQCQANQFLIRAIFEDSPTPAGSEELFRSGNDYLWRVPPFQRRNSPEAHMAAR